MITKSTVLVLGAGASQPFKYPTGFELRQKIIEKLADQNDPAYKLLEQTYFSSDDISQFQKALFHSSANNIDEFLENYPSYQDMGKRVITQILVGCEDDQFMFENSDWYFHLFGEMRRGSSFEGFAENKLAIITFNYDRSLEHYIYTSLKNFYYKTGDEAATIMTSIPVIHIYGQIGYLPWQKKTPERSYGNKEEKYLVETSKLIKVLHEKGDIEKDEALKQAHTLLEAAEKIYFLGFGYHKINLDRLKINSLDKNSKGIYGTAKGFTDKERKQIMSLSNNKIDLNLANVGNLSILQFMREHVELA
ncbi:MAG: hypothetical protein G01um10147_1179 [Microgenomates group bacterium Gr01-1014_7]|nr:MAG: hypothetical protein G01um10147_1179 [Microgenomates group bacterium Gr01-1014_7]